MGSCPFVDERRHQDKSWDPSTFVEGRRYLMYKPDERRHQDKSWDPSTFVEGRRYLMSKPKRNTRSNYLISVRFVYLLFFTLVNH